MDSTLRIVLDILRFTLPALIVFLTAWFLLKTLFEKQRELKALEVNRLNKKETVSMKLQAYERLVLFLERIELPALLMRISHGGMKASELRDALIVTIQKEYEHNISQQIYVSEQLWQIIQIARNQMVGTISELGNSSMSSASGNEFAEQLLKYNAEWEDNPVRKAKMAVKTEAGLLL